MIEYIYFVKCPNCDDEPFSFFDEAKEFALGCLSNKPVITQIEVNRNDFGECTDSSDLGTIWSWEDMVKETETEPAGILFNKNDFTDYDSENDPEFAVLDNTLDCDSLDSVPDNFRKPIPDGMSIKELVEAMEENEDTVECALCNELFPKEECHHHENEGWVCSDCLENTVECTWCGFLYDSSDCRYEVDLGWLCGRCEGAIKSRGETLTFRENAPMH